MEFSNKQEQGVTIVTIDGNIALEGTNELKDYIHSVLDSNSKGLIINCEQVNFIDSSGIGLIVSLFKSFQQKQQKFAITSLSPKLEEIFAMTRLNKIIPICDDDQSALEMILN